MYRCSVATPLAIATVERNLRATLWVFDVSDHHGPQQGSTHAGRDDGPTKRAFELDELQQFFDFADDEVARIISSHVKGGLAAWRDVTALKVCYGWGLRHDELRKLDIVDFSPNVETPYFGGYGLLRVRNGKPNKGAPKKQRTVQTLVDWVAGSSRGLGGIRPSPICPAHDAPFSHVDRRASCRGRSLQSVHRLRECPRPFPRARHSRPPPVLRDAHTNRLRLRREVHLNAARTRARNHYDHIYTLPSPDFAASEMERVLSKDLLRSKGKLLLKPARNQGRASRRSVGSSTSSTFAS